MRLIPEIPKTRIPVGDAQAERIRRAVRKATSMSTEAAVSRLARPEDAETFLEFLCDPSVSAPIYTLPSKINHDTVRAFIDRHIAERESGTGLLFFNYDENGRFSGYTDVKVWPHWAAGELSGAVHPDRQGRKRGVEGARRGFDWMFTALGLDVICETGATDNFRTARLLDGLGFRRVGKTLSRRDDGSERPSIVWEMRREEWDKSNSAD